MGRALAITAIFAAAFAGLTGGPPPATAAPTAGDDRWALVIGITKYQGKTKATAAGAADATDVRDALVRNGFPAGHIVTLTDNRATAANIRAGMQWLVDRSSPSSFSVLHYSGHVKQMGGDRDRDGEKVDEFLWPHDNRFIADAEVGRFARQLQGQAWINIAGCEGAGFDDGISDPRRLFTASSAETEKSYEYPSWNNSVFVGLLEQAMIENKDRNGNGKVSIHESFWHAGEMAPRMTARQKNGPQHPFIRGGNGEEWYFDGPPPPPSPPPREEPGQGGDTPRSCVPLCIG